MGLLDDAIREHLDLKRRRGADASEIERAERDALGPVRRSPEDLGTELSDVPIPPHEGEEYDQGYESDSEPAEHYVEDFAPPEHLEPSPPPDPELAAASPELELAPAPADPDLAPAPERDAGLSEPSAPQPPSNEATPIPSPHAAPEPPLHEGGETVEYDVEGEPEGDEMLEETPEFLQDTPEHDRLWFEQRPPRDFDFDD